jgi:RNA polymerase sigma factor (sigma-70 family)
MPPPAEGIATRLFLGTALRTQPDRRLVTLVREGYEAAFEEIVRRYAKPLSRYAASIVGGRSEDVTQDAFSKALLSLRRNDAEIELRPWLFRIVRNTALNDLRDSPPSPELLAEAIAGGRNPAEELESREELTDLIERLRALPESQRAAIVMRELEGLSHEEIAAALGMSGGAARQAIYRARQALREGAGMLIPLPLLQALLTGSGSGAAEAATGAAGIGNAAGAGVALKATAATVLVAGAVGAGAALKDNHRHTGDANAAPARASQTGAGETAPPPVVHADDGHRGSGETEAGDDRHGRGEPESGDDHGQHGAGEADEAHGGRGPSRAGDESGRSGSPATGATDDHGAGSDRDGGNHGSSPSATGGSGHEDGTDSAHGGGSGSGHGGSGSSDDSASRSGGGDTGSGGNGGGSGSSGGGQGPSEAPAPETEVGAEPEPELGSGSGGEQEPGDDHGGHG